MTQQIRYITGKLLAYALLLVAVATADASPIPNGSRQLVLTIVPDTQSSRGTMVFAQRSKPGGNWSIISQPVPVRLGRSGVIWGRGLHKTPKGTPQKREGDGMTPCGAFAIGQTFGTLDPKSVARQPNMRYTLIGEGDLWVEDSNSPHYNRHIKLPNNRPAQSAWEEKQQMKLNDNAHKLKLFIAHNAPPNVVPHGGSAIFFHIWRDNGGRATSGCTAMRERDLRRLIQWTNPAAKPVYVILTQTDYKKLRKRWGLPTTK